MSEPRAYNAADSSAALMHCLSVVELATYWRVSPRKVRALIRRGLLTAIDVGTGRQQLRITPDAIHECERRLAVTPRAQRRLKATAIDPEVAALLDLEQADPEGSADRK